MATTTKPAANPGVIIAGIFIAAFLVFLLIPQDFWVRLSINIFK